MNISVIYDSYNGHTEKMAKAVAEGARSVTGAHVRLKHVNRATLEDVLWADGVGLGSPTHMGAMGWQMKKFIDSVFSKTWMENLLIGKAAAVFHTGGSGAVGGAELVMLGMLSNLAENGMILVTHPRTTPGFKSDGMHWGPTCTTGSGGLGPKKIHLDAARSHGKRLAEVAGKLS